MTLEGTKEIVSQQGVAGLDFADEVATANKYARILRRRACRRSWCCCTRAVADRPESLTSTAATG